jgi:ParB family chromosome partitioning protein
MMVLDLSALDGVPAADDGGRHVPATAPPQAFEEDPAQPRFEFDEDDDFDALVEDIRQRGILQPLVVLRLPSGRLRIRFGARRFRAAVRAQLARIPYVETEDERQFDDYAQVAENARRRSLQPLELARFIARKLAAGERKKAIAARLHIDASAITHLLALTDDPPPLLMKLYHSRRCRAPYYLYQLRRLMRRDAALVERCVAAVAEIDRGLIEGIAQHLRQRGGVATMGGAPAAAVYAATTDATATPTSVPLAVAAKAPVEGASAKDGSGAAVLTRPQLFGVYRGRPMQLLLRRAPSAVGLAWLMFDDGETAELPLADLVLTALRQQGGGGR